MTSKVMRKIVKIDEEKCNGCGVCVPSCAEGALQIIDGKARLVSEIYCDGLGACLGECPQDAITIEEREAEDFDEVATEQHLKQTTKVESPVEDELPCGCPSTHVTQFEEKTAPVAEPLPCGCPSANIAHFEPETAPETVTQAATLGHWPVQLKLVPPGAPFLEGADLILAGDCVPFAYPNFHRDFLKDHALLVACPKLDDFEAHQQKLTEILRQSDVKSLSVLHMEVPCCFGLVKMVKDALLASGKNIPLTEVNIGVRGDVKSLSPV